VARPELLGRYSRFWKCLPAHPKSSAEGGTYKLQRKFFKSCCHVDVQTWQFHALWQEKIPSQKTFSCMTSVGQLLRKWMITEGMLLKGEVKFGYNSKIFLEVILTLGQTLVHVLLSLHSFWVIHKLYQSDGYSSKLRIKMSNNIFFYLECSLLRLWLKYIHICW